MYDPDSDTPAMARTSNLNEELGQVRSCVILFLLPLFFFHSTTRIFYQK